MVGLPFLQIFLGLNLLVIGALVTLAVQHGYAHFRPHQQDGKKPRPISAHLPVEMRDQLLHNAQTNFQTVLERSAAELEHDLSSTAVQLNRALEKLGTTVVGKEVERYRINLAQIREQSEKAVAAAQTELAEHQAALKAKLEESVSAERERAVQEIMAEKQQILKQIDTRLGDAVASFLVETLQHEIDLGAQSAYLTATLDAHKADFKQELGDVQSNT